MDIRQVARCLFCAVFLAAFTGCATDRNDGNGGAASPEQSQTCISYGPVRVDIVPVTAFRDEGEPQAIKVYVRAMDRFGSRIKAPIVFRFELYERAVHSTDPKGLRLAVWPDFDLIEAAANNDHWRDFLRAYEFELEYQPVVGRDYVLQTTCLTAGGRRLTAEFVLGTYGGPQR